MTQPVSLQSIIEHFGRAHDPTNDHPAQLGLRKPRLGYFGPIDERIDLELVGALAAATSHWQICLVGPHSGVALDALADRQNVHYFGPQPYEDLPRFVAGWDVCILPFGVHSQTRRLTPPQLLEYIAAERPIVSTPIAEIIDVCSDIVQIAQDSAGFISACERALGASDAQAEARVERMRARLMSACLDETEDEVSALLERAARSRARIAAASG